MQKVHKPSARNSILWVGLVVLIAAVLCIIGVVAQRDRSLASDKRVRAAFMQNYAPCLKGNYDLTNGARISVNPTDADGRLDSVVSEQVTVLSTLNSFSKPSVLRFSYAMVNQDTLFNTSPAPKFMAADQETRDFLHDNCPHIDQ